MLLGLLTVAFAMPDGFDKPCDPSVTHCPRQLPGTPRQNCASMPTFMQNADRIVGGEAAPSMIPWQVAMLSGSFQFCGGTVLDSCTILTAAHCNINTGHSIRAGSTNKQTGGQVRGISQVISNNDLPYNSNSLNNDWVIVKLDSPLELNDDVQPACLPSADYLPATATEARCFTSGWGTLSSGGSSTNNLQYVRVPAITNAQCNTAYGGSITDAMICAGYPGVGGKDACQGDSGGPFVCNDNGNAVIAGVVSWGNGCALADFPGVYARTTTALSWIQSNMGSSGSCAVAPTTAAPSPTTTAAPSPPSTTTAAPSPTTTAAPSPPSTTTAAPSPPTTTTASPTTTTAPPSTGCGFPQWQGDGYCDDDNNNDGCDYDGGDCCGDDVNTKYCTECECLDPDFEEDDCDDWQWHTFWCQGKKNQGKCNRPYVAKRCQKTCFNCEELSTEAPTEPPCQDKWSTSKCENKKNSWTKPCNWNWWVKHNCKKTCGLC